VRTPFADRSIRRIFSRIVALRFRHLALAEIKGAAPVRRPAAIVITDYGLGLAITESDAIALHGSLLPEHDCELATTKARPSAVPRFASRSFVEPQRKTDERRSRIWRTDLKLPRDLSHPSSEQQFDLGEDECSGPEASRE
jgi:hypothetical protein